MLDTFARDLRNGWRLLRRSPGFTAAAVMSLCLGTGASIALFSAADAFLLRPLAGRHGADLVKVFTSDFDGGLYGSTSYPDFEDLDERLPAFEGLFAYTPFDTNLTDRGSVVRVGAALVSPRFFEGLGVRLAAGRGFTDDDVRARSASPVVISHRMWQRRFEGDPSIVGRPATVNGQSYVIVGVAEDGFIGISFDQPADMWMTAPISARDSGIDIGRRNRRFIVLGRLRAATTLPEAQAGLDVTASQLFAAYPDAWRDHVGNGRRFTALPESRARHIGAPPGAMASLAASVVGVIFLLLAITCANVATMLVARGVTRRREIAVRLALGAGRRQIVAQLVRENLVLAAIGSFAGLTVSWWTLAAAQRMPMLAALPVVFTIDGRAIVFTLAATIATVLLFALLPAIQAARGDVNAALHDRPTLVVRRWLRVDLRDLLVVGQMAVALALVAVAALIVRATLRAQKLDPGFEPRGVILASVDLGTRGYDYEYDNPKGLEFARRALDALNAIPGVRVATVAMVVPLSGSNTKIEVHRRGQDGSEITETVLANTVGPSYFAAMRIPVLRGREMTSADRDRTAPTAIVTASLARQWWPDTDPIGQTLRTRVFEVPPTVVGVVADSAYESVADRQRGIVYLSALQVFNPRMTFHLVASASPALDDAIQRSIHGVDPQLAVTGIRTMDAHLAAMREPETIGSAVAAAAGLLELGLTLMALYGVVAYSVRQRTREIGIRMALGGTPNDIMRLVGKKAIVLASVGIGVGLLLAAAGGQVAASAFVDFTASDPVSFAAMAAFCFAAAVLAALSPARHAARIQPVEALRHD